MRLFPLLSCALLLGVAAGLPAEELPETRPALIGDGPRALINLIDTERLMQKGQKDAMVMFTCLVSFSGLPGRCVTYRGTPGSDALAQEVTNQCYEKVRFIPAVYHHKEVVSAISGTVIFRLINGHPHLRIFLNQENDHLLKANDFIAPQIVFPSDQKLKSWQYPGRSWLSSNVVLRVSVDATGKLLESKLIFETPKGEGFGQVVMKNIGNLTFLPGYLHGQPVACSANLEMIFQGAGRGARWKPDK